MFVNGVLLPLQLETQELDTIAHQLHVVLHVLQLVTVFGRITTQGCSWGIAGCCNERG